MVLVHDEQGPPKATGFIPPGEALRLLSSGRLGARLIELARAAAAEHLRHEPGDVEEHG